MFAIRATVQSYIDVYTINDRLRLLKNALTSLTISSMTASLDGVDNSELLHMMLNTPSAAASSPYRYPERADTLVIVPVFAFTEPGRRAHSLAFRVPDWQLTGRSDAKSSGCAVRWSIATRTRTNVDVDTRFLLESPQPSCINISSCGLVTTPSRTICSAMDANPASRPAPPPIRSRKLCDMEGARAFAFARAFAAENKRARTR